MRATRATMSLKNNSVGFVSMAVQCHQHLLCAKNNALLFLRFGAINTHTCITHTKCIPIK